MSDAGLCAKELSRQVESAPNPSARRLQFGELSAEEMLRRATDPIALRRAQKLTEAQQRALYSPWLEIAELARELQMFQPASHYQPSPLRGTLGLPGLALSAPPIIATTVKTLEKLGLVERWEECRDRYGETIESTPTDNPKHQKTGPVMLSETGEILGAALVCLHADARSLHTAEGSPQRALFEARRRYNDLRAEELSRRERSARSSESLLRELEEELRGIAMHPEERTRLLRGYQRAATAAEAEQGAEPAMPIRVSVLVELIASARDSGREEGLREGDSDYW